VRSDSAQSGLQISQLVRERYRQHADHQERIAAGEPARSGLPTGVDALDDLLGGVTTGIVTIVAGRPGMGKSALGLTIAMAMIRAGVGVHVFSLEDTRNAYADRLLSRTSQVPVEALRSGRALNLVEQRDLVQSATGCSKAKRWVLDDRAGIDAAEIVRAVRRGARDNETRAVVVDYVQLLKRRPRASMHEHLGEQISILADAAKQDDMAYIVMSQLNRGLEARDDKMPKLSDLRESGSLEERAKAVIAVHRPWVYDHDLDPAEMILCVLKNSQGQIGKVRADFHGPTVTVR